jgi:hypothetical protein
MMRPEIAGFAQKKESTVLLRRYIVNKIGGERWRDRGKRAQMFKALGWAILASCELVTKACKTSLFLEPAPKRGSQGKFRVISTARLKPLRILHLQPINVVIYNVPIWNSHLGASFALRCFQHLSLPSIATQRCTWRHNCYTRG